MPSRTSRCPPSGRASGSAVWYRVLVRSGRRLDNVTSVSTALRGGVIRPRTRHQIGLAELLGVRAAVSDPLISGITIDSRLVRPGDLYVALSGAHHHGAEFAQQAAAAGAVAVLTDTAGSLLAHGVSLPVVVVDHPRQAMAGCRRHHLRPACGCAHHVRGHRHEWQDNDDLSLGGRAARRRA